MGFVERSKEKLEDELKRVYDSQKEKIDDLHWKLKLSFCEQPEIGSNEDARRAHSQLKTLQTEREIAAKRLGYFWMDSHDMDELNMKYDIFNDCVCNFCQQHQLYCCEKRCYPQPMTQVDGMACTKCRSFSFCVCMCKTFRAQRAKKNVCILVWNKEYKLVVCFSFICCASMVCVNMSSAHISKKEIENKLKKLYDKQKNEMDDLHAIVRYVFYTRPEAVENKERCRAHRRLRMLKVAREKEAIKWGFFNLGPRDMDRLSAKYNIYELCSCILCRPPSFCCQKRCRLRPPTRAKEIACRKCNNVGFCICKCKTFGMRNVGKIKMQS